MKLAWVRIQNFRNCRDIELQIGQIHAIVGSNNAGKSTILKALDLLFNPSITKINHESFWHRQPGIEIRIEGRFNELTDKEKNVFKGYLRDEDSLHLARTATIKDVNSDEEPQGSYEITTYFNSPVPLFDWLIESNINEKNITEWWKNRENLQIRGKSFWVNQEVKPKVAEWKDNAKRFVERNLTEEDFKEAWQINPKGFPNVLKAYLPHFELIPAVREAVEESKVLRTNPFGRLISELASKLDPAIKEAISENLRQTTSRLNRGDNNERLQGINEFEAKISGYLKEVIPSELEIEFQTPTIESLLSTPKVIVDDGFKGSIEGKGHGLQRTVIFSILRSYADMITKSKEDRRNLIIGFEEPELYMHPTAQRSIRSMFRRIADAGDQILFTTHSPLLVDVTNFDEIIRLDNQKDGELSFAKAYQVSMDHIMDDFETRNGTLKGKVTQHAIRERYNHAYTPNRNEGFFAKKLILVEGSTELYCIPIYADAMGLNLDVLGISVIECGGKDQIDRLYRIFNELGIPCYVVFDHDHANTDSMKLTTELLDLLRYSTTDVHQTIIESEFTCFQGDWESELRPQIPNCEKLTGEATRFIGKGGKPLIARYIACKLVSQNPPHIPESLCRLINKAVNVEYKGSCLKSSAQMPRWVFPKRDLQLKEK